MVKGSVVSFIFLLYDPRSWYIPLSVVVVVHSIISEGGGATFDDESEDV